MDHLRICLNVVRGSSGFQATALLFWRQLGNLLTHHRGRFFHLQRRNMCGGANFYDFYEHTTECSFFSRECRDWGDNNNKHFPGHKFTGRCFAFHCSIPFRKEKQLGIFCSSFYALYRVCWQFCTLSIKNVTAAFMICDAFDNFISRDRGCVGIISTISL